MRVIGLALVHGLITGPVLAGCRDGRQVLRDASFDALLPLWQLAALRNPAKITIADAYTLALKEAGFTPATQPWSAAIVDAMFKITTEDVGLESMAAILRKQYGTGHPRWKDKFAKSWAKPLSALLSGRTEALNKLDTELHAQSEQTKKALEKARTSYYDCQWHEIEDKKPESPGTGAKPEDPEADLVALEDLTDSELSPLAVNLERATKVCTEYKTIVEDSEAKTKAACSALETSRSYKERSDLFDSVIAANIRLLEDGFALLKSCAEEAGKVKPGWVIEQKLKKLFDRAIVLRNRIDQGPELSERMQTLMNRLTMEGPELMISAMRLGLTAKLSRALVIEDSNCIETLMDQMRKGPQR